MPEARHDLGLTARLNANATGAPGQRRFRLLVEAERGTACLWLEKEQLFQLALAIQQLLTSAQQRTVQQPAPESLAGEGPSFDFKVERLALGHDEERDLFLLVAYEAATRRASRPILGLWATRQQLHSLAEEALEVCAAGRPLCQLCGGPIGPGPHICPRSNGHAAL
ncbi:MAG: DUF3090 family protein [Chloroflexi bacterium]|nr:DUF3090 family protein [Chloroflexota bacterium]